jgi:hypothetical protein
MAGVFEGKAVVNVSRSGHVLTGVVVIYETRNQNGDRTLNYYGTGKGPVQNGNSWFGQTIGTGLNTVTWNSHAAGLYIADIMRKLK